MAKITVVNTAKATKKKLQDRHTAQLMKFVCGWIQKYY